MLLTLDFETYFSQTYSLRNKKINTSEYIRHPEFKVQCVGIKVNDEKTVWFPDRFVDRALSSFDWSTVDLLCHNTAFDGFILSHHYGIVPRYYLDTLSMARALHSTKIGAGLDEVARYYNLGNKIPDVLGKTKGVRDLDQELMLGLGMYCAEDVELTKRIYDKMILGYPKKELDLIDLTIRMFCDPLLEVDIPRVERELENEVEEKKRLIAMTKSSIDDLSSANKFAEALVALGATPPKKESLRTGKQTWAFAKNDIEFQKLRDHEFEAVRDLVNARLAAKSTIGETRALRFLTAGENGWKLPVLLKYYGAHTGRWSAGNSMNMQNLKRGGELRQSILAPDGHSIVVVDSGQIEARVTAWLAQDKELLELFREGRDVYKYMASQIYDVPVEEVTKDQRFIGKIAILGLGYGMGGPKFFTTLVSGAMGPVVDIELAECYRIVNSYRLARNKIVDLWEYLDSTVLLNLSLETEAPFGPNDFLSTKKEFRIALPNGMHLQYPNLSGDEGNYTHCSDKENRKAEPKFKKIYGGLLTENIVQALARIIIADQLLKISDNLKGIGRVVTTTHDEIVVVVPDHLAESTLAMMHKEMTTPSEWCMDLPLAAEGGFAHNYSK
jgi:DNA polymerase